MARILNCLDISIQKEFADLRLNMISAFKRGELIGRDSADQVLPS